MNRKLDMTRGSITKLTFLFALPICLGNILQQLYNTVDTVVIGKYCGATSIAAVGTSAQPIEILLCIFLGISGGVSILVSQATGRNDNKEIEKLVKAAVSFVYTTSIIITLLGVFLGPQILKLMQVPDDTMDLAVIYIRIVLLGTLGLVGYNTNAGILRGLGDSTSSVIFLVFSCFINIALDLLFVAVFHLNVFGVALATMIATYFSWIFSIIYIRKHYPQYHFPILPKKCDMKILRKIIAIGLPLGLNSSLYSFGHTVVQTLVNTQGSTFIAACVVASKLSGISSIAVSSFSSAALTFTGQNLGAGNYKRIKQGGIQIPLLSGAFALTGDILMFIFCRQFISFFTKDPQVLRDAVHYIHVVIPFSWCFAVFNGILNVVNGLGHVKYTTIVNSLMLWAVRIPSAIIITKFINGYYLMASIPISFVFGMFSMLIFYKTKYWKEIKAKALKEKLETISEISYEKHVEKVPSFS